MFAGVKCVPGEATEVSQLYIWSCKSELAMVAEQTPWGIAMPKVHTCSKLPCDVVVMLDAQNQRGLLAALGATH